MAGRPRTRARKALEALEAEKAAGLNPADSDAADAFGEPVPIPDAASGRDRPPRRRAASGGASPAAGGSTVAGDKRPASIRKIEQALAQNFVVLGLGVSLVDPFDGQTIGLNADKLAKAWADLAAQNPQVRKVLEGLLLGSAWGAAIGQTVMVALPIAVRHGYAPINFAHMAVASGIKIPDFVPDAPEPEATGGGDVGPEVPPSPEVDREEQHRRDAAADLTRHPFDGTPVDEPPIVEGRVFPHNPDDVARGRGDAAA
jgi:hypothetical protein